jgi:hypothetical protein
MTDELCETDSHSDTGRTEYDCFSLAGHSFFGCIESDRVGKNAACGVLPRGQNAFFPSAVRFAASFEKWTKTYAMYHPTVSLRIRDYAHVILL